MASGAGTGARPGERRGSGSDQLVTIKEGVSAVNAPYPTIWRWANENPEALGVKRFGGKIFLSLRKLKFFAHRTRYKF
jgi:hypothetical protein